MKRRRAAVHYRDVILPSRWIIRTALDAMLVLLAIGSVSAQTQMSAQRDAMQLLSELSKQVCELRIEVAALRLAWQEQRMQTLEKQIRAAESERRLAEYENVAARDEILVAEIQLAGSDLDAEERAELTSLKNALLTEGRQRLGDGRAETAERESALRSDWERERAAAEGFRRTLNSLRCAVAAVSPSKPTQ